MCPGGIHGFQFVFANVEILSPIVCLVFWLVFLNSIIIIFLIYNVGVFCWFYISVTDFYITIASFTLPHFNVLLRLIVYITFLIWLLSLTILPTSLLFFLTLLSSLIRVLSLYLYCIHPFIMLSSSYIISIISTNQPSHLRFK